MYREPDYSHLKMDLDNLSRYKINSLEMELSQLYQNPNLHQLSNKDSILELEQRLLVVRKRKRYLDDMFKIDDEINNLEGNVRTEKFFTRVGAFFLSPIFGAIGIFSYFQDSIQSAFLLGMGAAGTLAGIVATGFSYKDWKISGAKLKKLKESAEYKALTESYEYKKLLQREFVKLPKAEITETKQLPSAEDMALPGRKE